MNSLDEQIKLFKISNDFVKTEFKEIEKTYNISIIVNDDNRKRESDDYYAQFEASIKMEAEMMSKYYQLFYCLEKSARMLVNNVLSSMHSAIWWDECVPDNVKANVEANIQREIDSGFSIRSNENIDYTTFGELGEIVKKNWDNFSDIFSSQRAFTKVMNSLNLLRGPIAHCCVLSDDEIVRLKLTVRDWFRLME